MLKIRNSASGIQVSFQYQPFFSLLRCLKMFALFRFQWLFLTESLYDQEFKKSLQHPEEYWAKIAEDIIWTKKWKKVLDHSNSPFTKWFVGGRLSLCYNAVDRHIDEGRSNQRAFVWDSPITGKKSTITYIELKSKVSSVEKI